MRKKRSSSILKKFLLFNFFVFLVLGLFTILYLKAIQPNLIKKRSSNHFIIIKNTNDHLQRLNINLNNEDITKFLLSTRFLFQNLNRVQFFDLKGDLVGDTNILDLDQTVFEKDDQILEESIDGQKFQTNKKIDNYNFKDSNKSDREIIRNYQGKPFVFDNIQKNNFFINTLSDLRIDDTRVGFIKITEEANDILVAVKERKNFILRTVFIIALVIFLFSVFLNRYILKPIGALVEYTKSIKAKDEPYGRIEKFLYRSDEVGLLSRSLNEMTKDLQNRTKNAEDSSADLAHEIRNPLASLKGASELLDSTTDKDERKKLISILSHDVERIDRLITDYSKMLKDEASLSREKMTKFNLLDLAREVSEEFKNNRVIIDKNISFKISQEKPNGHLPYVFGAKNRMEQVLANLIDNAASFSPDYSFINISIHSAKEKITLVVKDEGPGFKETNTERIFKRFYSNRPEKFGEHSGLGLNIVKNIIEMHDGEIIASNRKDNNKGAQIKIILPTRS